MSDPYQDCRTVAEQAALAAGGLLLGMYGKVTAREKRPGDLVTEADFASQQLIADILLTAFPSHTLLGEEDGAEPDPANPWRWVVDPIDGTVNFAHGFPLWCVSIALEHAGELVVGVIHEPLTGRLYAATKGQGAQLDGRAMRGSAAGQLRESLIATGFPTDFGADSSRQLALLARMSTGTHSVRRTGSSALNMAFVASGGLDAFYATSIQAWDVAAGVVLVREAGGTVTRFSGEGYDLYAGQILATNGHVHAETVKALTETLDDRSKP